MFSNVKLHRKAIELTPGKAPRASPSSVVFISVSSPVGVFFDLLLWLHKWLHVFSSLDHLCLFFSSQRDVPCGSQPPRRLAGGEGRTRAGLGENLPDKPNSAPWQAVILCYDILLLWGKESSKHN